jgi:hypothetical protein
MYKNKYLKYKSKYLSLLGGSNPVDLSALRAALGDDTPPLTPLPICLPLQIKITQLCCDESTQFASRMAHCEDPGTFKPHTLAAYGSWITGIQDGTSLDGIVKIDATNINVSENIHHIQKINYISDHNGIVLNLNISPINFNIISFNLEGLCRRYPEMNKTKYNDNEFNRRLELLQIHLIDYVKVGAIIACQELALQLYKDNLPLQNALLDDSGKKILNELLKFNPNLQFESDTYTGGIYYDKSIWTVMSLSIPRLTSKGFANKFSNAYLFTHKNIQLWVVNIHLKAPDLTTTWTTITEAHKLELSNIINTIYNNNFKIPIYLCGDYNNIGNKKDLIVDAIKSLKLPVQII